MRWQPLMCGQPLWVGSQMLTGKTPDDPEIQLLSLALIKHGMRACVRSNPGYGQSWRLGVKCSFSHPSVFAGPHEAQTCSDPR
ncbi:hypothetical protein BDP81DRAFT_415313 [Colletotrichum phormii]|uniref:Uncharacterized protein n=1 Tax=Colletotrichum phormii TaxID=359342 RepID=A0AAJ0A1C2_9PEZI|nr:uncharacterized protein BDP81DRAFT_415313 [Colletotrichum phormii]KAK1654254.1 hypothetical protein BDP81DRAFT_415313 [Colletotrichum phormii]